ASRMRCPSLPLLSLFFLLPCALLSACRPPLPTRRSSDLLAGVPAIELRAISNPVGEADRGRWRIEDALAALRDGVRRLLEVQDRSEEHTSELQSHLNLVFRLLLENKKNPATRKHAMKHI